MKLKRRRALEVPPKIRSFINSVTVVPLENINEPLKGFLWDFDKGDFHHWVDLFNHFDTYFERYIKSRKDVQLENNLLGSDPPFPKEVVLQILCVIRIILENCTNKHFYSSYEQHLSSLLACTDADVVEACLQTLATFSKKPIGKHSIRDSTLNSKLHALAQGWGVKEEGLGLISCAVSNGCDPIAFELGCTLHYEFYALSDSLSRNPAKEQAAQGLQIIHIPTINTCLETDLELLSKLVAEYNVPMNLRFSLLTRLRYARAFGSLATRQQYTCIRLYAFIILLQTNSDADDLASFFNTEPEFVNELVSLLSYEDVVPEKIRILCLHSLVALCQDRSRQPTVLSAVTSGGHRGILSSLMQKAIDSVCSDTSKQLIMFSEALLSLVTVLVSSSSGCSALREAGFIPTLLPLLKDTNPLHLHLVSSAVHILEAFMDYSNPAAALFRDLGGLDDTISRLKVEVSHVENTVKQQDDDSGNSETSIQVISGASATLDEMQPIYDDTLILNRRRLLMKVLLRAISLGTYAPGNTARIYGSEESLLPQCLCIIFKRAKKFGGGVFSLAATVMSDLIHKDPTCFPILDAAGLPSAFLDAIMDGVLCSTEAITCIPQCLDALCLNNNGLQVVKDRHALRCFVKIFTSRAYLRAITSDTPGSLSSGLDELMRHASSLRGLGVDMLIEILNAISKIGNGADVHSIPADPMCSFLPTPMETDGSISDDKEPSKMDSSDQTSEPSSDSSLANIESFLPECVSNVARLLETILQNADTCCIFVEKNGIESVLQLFTLPLMPFSVSVGQSISVAFKNFSPQHSASLAQAVCSFLRELLKSTNELLVSIGGTQLVLLESSKRTKILRCLFSLENILSLFNFLLKGTTTVVSELGNADADADVLKDLGSTYREIIWRISFCNDLKFDVKRNIDEEPENVEAASLSAVERDSDDDTNIPAVRSLNPVFVSNNSQSLWGGEREFLSVFRSGEGLGLHRRTRHGITRMRGGRTCRHLEAMNFDSEASNVSEMSPSQDLKKKSPDIIVFEILNKLATTMRSFFAALVKGFTPPNRRRADSGLSSASKTLGTSIAKIFLEALSFSGQSTSVGLDTSLSVKCRYLGKVVDDMAVVTFDSRRRTCYSSMVNNFYVNGTFKELLTTFEATSQLLWNLPYSMPASSSNNEKIGEESRLAHSSWLLDTLQSYCRLLENFVNSSLVLSPTSASQAHLLVQPVAVGLSIGLFPVPRDPEAFVRMLQSQVLDVILPVWNNPMFPQCSPGLIASIVSLVTHVYSGVGDVKLNRNGIAGSASQHFMPPPPDEATVATIVEMGFSRARAEDALRRVETNSVEMAMEWLFSHPEDPVQEDDELARALALSLGSSSDSSKPLDTDKSADVVAEEGCIKTPPVDDILVASVRLFQSSDAMAFPLTDLLVTLCNRNRGEDRSRVASYLIQQLKLFPLDFSKDTNAPSMLLHIIALILFEDPSTRETAAQNGVVSSAIEILTNFRVKNESGIEIVAPKCVSALLLILDSMLQYQPKIFSESIEGTQTGANLAGAQASLSIPVPIIDKKLTPYAHEQGSALAFENILGKSTGYLTIEESQKVLLIGCDLIKQHVPAVMMQAVMQLCARLTKCHSLALQFLENGGLTSIFGLPRSSFFPGYDLVVSAIVRHLLEDPHTLQTAMEWEIRQILSNNRNRGRMSVRMFLTSMAPVICRDPVIFLKAAAVVCQLETSEGRTSVLLSKENEKSKTSVVEARLASSDSVRILENKINEGSGKCSKGHKKIPANLTQVIDLLLEIVLKFPLPKNKEDFCSNLSAMEVDEPATKVKGKSKVGETKKSESESEQSAGLAKVTFVLKLLSDILLMYVNAVGVILKRDSELFQTRASNLSDNPGYGGIFHYVLHWLLPLTMDKSAGPDEWRDKLSEKASWFLVVLCGRSGEGRRRVINELVKALSSLSTLESNSTKSVLLPDKKVYALLDLVYSILSKNSSSSNIPGSGCSPDIAKSMIDGGMVPCLTSILQVIDLDHPDAPKSVNLILKALEGLTRAANASEQIFKSDDGNKKKSVGLNGRPDDHLTAPSTAEVVRHCQNASSEQHLGDLGGNEEQNQGHAQRHGNDNPNTSQPVEQDMRIEVEEQMTSDPAVELGVDFMHEEMEDGSILRNPDQMEMTFRVENRENDDMGDEDDDMGDEGEDDEDDDEGEDEDEDIAEHGGGMMSLANTYVEDHDDTGLEDDYNEEMIDEEDDDFHENQVIEVRWREALDGLDHLQVLGQPGAASGLIDVAAEPFEGVNVDDLFGLRRPLGFERRRQNVRSSFERPVAERNAFQHPLLSRPSHSGDMVSMFSSVANSSRDSEALSSGNFDVSNFYMFDAPVLPYDHASGSLYGDRFGGGAPPPLTDFSVGIDSLQLPGRRRPVDGRWTFGGHPQGSAHAAAVANSVEEQFVSHLRSHAPVDTPERPSQDSEIMEKQQYAPPFNNSQAEVERGNSSAGRSEGPNNGDELAAEGASCVGQVDSQPVSQRAQECQQMPDTVSVQSPFLNHTPGGHDSMEIGEGNCTSSDEVVAMLGVADSTAGIFADQQHDRGFDASFNFHDIPVQAVGGDRSLITAEVGSIQGDSGSYFPNLGDLQTSVPANLDVDMNGIDTERNQNVHPLQTSECSTEEQSSVPNSLVTPVNNQADPGSLNDVAACANAIDPTFLEALPEDIRAEVLASQRAQSVQLPTNATPSGEDIDPEFLAALPPDIQAEILAQQRAQRMEQQADGQPLDMDNASIIATLPADIREEVLLTSSEAVLSALPSPLLAEAQMLRNRAMSHYQARSLFGSTHRLNSRRNGLGFDRQSVMDRGVGVTIGQRTVSGIADKLKDKEIEGEPLLDASALKALIRLLLLAQPLGKGLLQRLLLNLCAHSITRAILVRLLLEMIKPEAEGSISKSPTTNSQRLYGCQSNVVYGRSQLLDGVPPLVLQRIIEILTYLATNHSGVANLLFYFDPSNVPDTLGSINMGNKNDKGKEKIEEGIVSSKFYGNNLDMDIPLVLFLKLLNRPLFLRSTGHLEQVMVLLQVVVHNAASRMECHSQSDKDTHNSQNMATNEATDDMKKDPPILDEPSQQDKHGSAESSTSDGKKINDMFLQLPQSGLSNLCQLLGRDGLSDKVYTLAVGVLKKLASVAVPQRKFFTIELSELAHSLSSSAANELVTLRNTQMLGLSTCSMAGAAILRVLQALIALTSHGDNENLSLKEDVEQEEHATMWKLNVALEPLWQELSECISAAETQLGQNSSTPAILNVNVEEHVQGSSSSSPLPPGTQRLLPFIEAFFVLCEKIQANQSNTLQDHADVTVRELKDSTEISDPSTTRCSGDPQRKYNGVVTFTKFAEKHRRLLNSFIRQNPGLLEKSLSMMLKASRLIDFDNKRAYFRSRIRQQHEQHLAGPLRISIRRAYVLEDSYNQLRMRPTLDLKGRLNVQFQGEEGIDAGGLTREWYQLLSRVIFDKGALLFTTVGNNATFQPNPNSVYQTEHLSYFKFVGRVVAKALFDGQLLDVYFTRSFYKHILGVKVTYHDIEAVDPDYYKNLKWMLENDVSDIPDLTFSMDADEEKHILYEKNQVTDYELKPGGRNIRVTEETKHEYVDLVADHILTNAIRPQINSFLEGFNELVPRELISIFNDKELELLISGLPEIDLEDLKVNTEYTGYTAASSVVQWFWEVVKSFNKEDMARLLQFVTGTSKVPLEGFKALQGISGSQRFQIHKAYGPPDRLPSAHTCFNQLDLPEYTSKEQLHERLLLAIHEASEGFGFG